MIYHSLYANCILRAYLCIFKRHFTYTYTYIYNIYIYICLYIYIEIHVHIFNISYKNIIYLLKKQINTYIHIHTYHTMPYHTLHTRWGCQPLAHQEATKKQSLDMTPNHSTWCGVPWCQHVLAIRTLFSQWKSQPCPCHFFPLNSPGKRVTLFLVNFPAATHIRLKSFRSSSHHSSLRSF